MSMQILYFNYRDEEKMKNTFQDVPNASKLIVMCLQQDNLLLRYIIQQVYYKLWIKWTLFFALNKSIWIFAFHLLEQIWYCFRNESFPWG